MWAELKAFAKSVLPSTIKDAIDSEEIAATSKHDKDFLQVEVKVQVSCIEFLNNMHVAPAKTANMNNNIHSSRRYVTRQVAGKQ